MDRRRTRFLAAALALAAALTALTLGVATMRLRARLPGPLAPGAPGPGSARDGAGAGSQDAPSSDRPSAGSNGSGTTDEGTTQGQPRDSGLRSGPGIVLEGTRIVIPRPSGEPEWDLSAGKVEISEDSGDAKLTDVQGARYVEGEAQALVRAHSVAVDVRTGRLEFAGGVEVAGERGARFSAAKAVWDPGRSRFLASGGVEFTDGPSTITAGTIEADGALEEVVVKGKARFKTVVRGG